MFHHNPTGYWLGVGLYWCYRCYITPLAGDWPGARLYLCYWVLQVLHHTGAGARHVDGRSASRPRWHRQDGDHQRHGALSGKVRCRLQLLRPDGLQRAWPHLQRSDAGSPLPSLVAVLGCRRGAVLFSLTQWRICLIRQITQQVP